MYLSSTYALLDKLVEIADSERRHQVHRCSAFKFLLTQLQRTVTFIDDIDDREPCVQLIDSILTLDSTGVRSLR